jgi:hypothetical protein
MPIGLVMRLLPYRRVREFSDLVFQQVVHLIQLSFPLGITPVHQFQFLSEPEIALKHRLLRFEMLAFSNLFFVFHQPPFSRTQNHRA